MEPAVGARMQDLSVAEFPGMHAYTDIRGWPPLVARLAALTAEQQGIETSSAEILVTAGGTGGLGALAGATVAPGQEVLILAPHWPLIAGIVRSFHGIPVPVPFWALPAGGVAPVASAEAAVAAVEAQRTPRTVALYLNSPHNPTGGVLARPIVEALVAWARDRGLWIWSDEVYEQYRYNGVDHVHVRPLAPERTVSVHSFSKWFGMAGNRVGWLAGPASVLGAAAKIGINTYYHAPTAGMVAALRALDVAGDWVRDARASYAEVGRQVASRLGVEAPAGSTFLFLDLGPHLGGRGLQELLERAADRGLLLAPGPSFGPYPNHVRLCFTACNPEKTLRGVDVLARLLGR
jgi:N-succinyldiaminopimelate aminotransferase